MHEKAACDLVLLSWNHPECTRPCVESILKNTSVPARLIVVDQGSARETKAALKQFHPTPFVEIEILWNPENVGYPKGMNQGLRTGEAPYVCFLNNDILVAPGWLQELIRVAESDPSVGAVSPSSNTFGIHPPKGSDWIAFSKAKAFSQGRWIEVKYAEGFCLLAKREILEKVGGFDEVTYEQIYFEDADLGRKIQALGLRCVMAEGTYVWHEGGKTMEQRPERLRLFQENERRFLRRWGNGKRVLYAVGNNSPLLLRKIGEESRCEANRSGEVWILLSHGAASDGLPRHLNIRIASQASWKLPWLTLWKALTKKKKFDLIVTDMDWVKTLLLPLHFIHKARIEHIEGGHRNFGADSSVGRAPDF